MPQRLDDRLGPEIQKINIKIVVQMLNITESVCKNKRASFFDC